MTAFKKTISVLAGGLIVAAMAIFFSAPAKYAQGVLKGVSLWAANVLPATFPFLFLTALLSKLRVWRKVSTLISPLAGKVFRLSGEGGAVMLLSALSGYPVGAKLCLELSARGRMGRRESFRLACLCTSSGPMFLVGAVGSLMYRSTKTGWLMLLSHLAAVWIVGALLPAGRRSPTPAPARSARAENALYDSLYGAVISILCVGGFIALFTCFGEMLSSLGIFALLAKPFGGSPYAEGVIRGLMEMTTGCAALSAYKTPLSAALSCGLTTFGGMCVLCQQAAYLGRAGINLPAFIAVKGVQAVVAFGICLVLTSVF